MFLALFNVGAIWCGLVNHQPNQATTSFEQVDTSVQASLSANLFDHNLLFPLNHNGWIFYLIVFLCLKASGRCAAGC